MQPRADNAIYQLAQALTRLQAFAFPVELNEVTRAYFEGVASPQSLDHVDTFVDIYHATEAAFRKATQRGYTARRARARFSKSTYSAEGNVENLAAPKAAGQLMNAPPDESGVVDEVTAP
jgi:hypothetical protein